MQKWCGIARFNWTRSEKKQPANWLLPDRRIHGKWLVGAGKDEGKCGAASSPLLLSSLPSSVRVFVFSTEINCSLFINLLMVGNCFSPPSTRFSQTDNCTNILPIILPSTISLVFLTSTPFPFPTSYLILYVALKLAAYCHSNVSGMVYIKHIIIQISFPVPLH